MYSDSALPSAADTGPTEVARGGSDRPIADLSIVIPVRDDAEFLARCLDALAAQTVGQREVIVVDNDSSDPTAVVGKPRLATLRQSRTGTLGVWEGQDRQRRPVVVVEARSRLTGWTVATSIPQTIVDARVRRWVWAFAGFGLLTLAISNTQPQQRTIPGSRSPRTRTPARRSTSRRQARVPAEEHGSRAETPDDGPRTESRYQ